ILSQIWDECARHNSTYFVLTTYDFWIFGAFVDGFTRGVISQIIPRDAKEPNVSQWLVFWFASAIGIPGGWERPVSILPVFSTH
ncbi:hypothetical protein M422DRAFT_154607, partial [Sphaerobolus stellatus SS14]